MDNNLQKPLKNTIVSLVKMLNKGGTYMYLKSCQIISTAGKWQNLCRFSINTQLINQSGEDFYYMSLSSYHFTTFGKASMAFEQGG